MRTLLPTALLLSAPATAAAQTYFVEDRVPSGAGDGLRAGHAVDLWGTRLAVGSNEVPSDQGGAWIFERNSGGAWTEVAALAPDDGLTKARFGSAVALDGDTLVVGAEEDSSLLSWAGSAYVFERAGDGSWKQTAKLVAWDPTAGARFGAAVDVSGDRIAIGAPRADGQVIDGVGACYLFERDAAGDWGFEAKLSGTFIGQPANVDFGRDVALWNDHVAVGVPQADAGGTDTGSVFVFEASTEEDGGWDLETILSAGDDDPFDLFGWSVALEGGRLFVGAPGEDSAGGAAGAVYVAERLPQGGWVETQKLVSPTPKTQGDFGRALAADGIGLVVGAPGEAAEGVTSGAAHLFTSIAGGPFVHRARLEPQTPAPSDRHGRAVAIAGGHLAVGAPEADPAAPQSGEVAIHWSYAPTSQPGPFNQGQGSKGCDGLLTMGSNLPPLLGTNDFAPTTTQAPPLSVGVLVITPTPLSGPTDLLGLGVDFLVDPFAVGALPALPMFSDADGLGRRTVPIPDAPVLAGLKLNAQSFWAWTSCVVPTGGLSSSDRLSFALGTP